MKKKFYSAFTLIEMLIVMGILIILMVVGITAGRYAVNRANDVAHQNAVKQIYEGLQAYYTDNRSFPDAANVETLIGNAGDDSALLYEYLDSGSFKGGTTADYVYMVNTLNQSVLVCVTLGGQNDESQQGIYCDGNGFGDENITTPISGTSITKANLEYGNATDELAYEAILGYDAGTSTWYGDSNGWTAPL